MCGILAILNKCAIESKDLRCLEEFIDKRGPDYQSELNRRLELCNLSLDLKASVLHMRGTSIQKQPILDEHGNLLVFNGQIYRFLSIPLEKNVSDTRFLVDKLQLCKTKSEIAETFAEIDGPFAFLHYNMNLKSLFFGRDLFGRRSLCTLSGNDSENLCPSIIASVSDRNYCKSIDRPPSGFSGWNEVDCSGFHCLDFSQADSIRVSRFLWNLDKIYPQTKKCQRLNLAENDVELISLKSIPLAPLHDDPRSSNDFSEIERKLAVIGLEQKLLNSVAIRIHDDVNRCLSCRKTNIVENCNHSKVAVAFSGGIDSTLLALAIDKVFNPTETIDLVTVAFKQNSPDRQSVGEAFKELCKVSAKRNWRLVLCDISKNELELTREEVIKYLIDPCKTVIDDSIGCACWFIGRARGRALDSMKLQRLDSNFEEFLRYDDARIHYPDEIKSDYTSPATMFFVGASIDEQLGGYSSHRSAWSNSGVRGVYDEISFLMRRISSRNLGRDDRTYSHHGRDVKLPYLDYDLVSFLNQLPINMKMDLSGPNLRDGPKKILRELASHWGLIETSHRVKRAMQFGTRIANLENIHEKGDEICQRLL